MKTRILTALVLAPLVILLTLYLPTAWYGGVLVLAIAMGLHEWSRLTIDSDKVFWLGLITVLLVIVAAFTLGGLLVLCFVATAMWVFHLYDLWRNGMSTSTRTVTTFVYGIVGLVGAWAALVYLHGSSEFGPAWTIAAMVVVWAADSCAYFAGKALGRHKLAPEISPGKTVEGVIGGLVGSAVVAAIMGTFLPGGSSTALWVWVLASVVAAAVSVGGDLYESRLKRNAGVKDSGTLLPGHGGVLDRIDGLIPAAPVLVTLLVVLS